MLSIDELLKQRDNLYIHKVAWRALPVATLGAGVVCLAVVLPAAHDPSAHLGDLAAVAAPPVSVDWERDRSLAALRERDATALIATVVGTRGAPPITAEDAGAPSGTPDLPREMVRLATDLHMSGPEIDAEFDLVRVLPPSGVSAEEDEPYRAGEQYLLFVNPAEMPGAWQPRAWQLVSLDGRMRVRSDGTLRGYLPNGPADELNRTLEVMAAVREAAR